MTVEALRRRRPETLGQLLEAYGRELQAVAYLILRDRARSGGRRDRDAADGLRTRRLDPRRARAPGAGCCESRRTRPSAGGDGPPGSCGSRWHPTRRAPATSRPSRPRVSRCSMASTRLPIQMRAALVLRYYADLSVDEVATALGKSPNTIKAQLQTALDRLRIHLADPVGASLREARHA